MRETERKPTRHPDWDYTTPGYYFVTIVVHQHACLLGEIMNDELTLSPAGEIVQQTWFALPEHYPNARVKTFIIMPNHVHGIIELREINPQLDDDIYIEGEFAIRRGGFRNPPLL